MKEGTEGMNERGNTARTGQGKDRNETLWYHHQQMLGEHLLRANHGAKCLYIWFNFKPEL